MDVRLNDGNTPKFLLGHCVADGGGRGLCAGAAGGGLGLGPVLFAQQTGQGQERHLRVRPGIQGRCLDSFRSEYYLYAIIFLVFDVETIFLLPFAVSFGGLSVGAFLAMVVFLLLLVEGLVWAWRKGVLTWK